MTDTEDDPAKLKCPLCPDSGPPTPNAVKVAPVTLTDSTNTGAHETNGSSTDGEAPDLYWIECSRCKEWYHSVCLLITDERGKRSVPEEIVTEVQSTGAEGVWEDWTSWVNRWYCPGCLDWSVDPTNEKRPHHPLVATLNKKSFPPKKVVKRIDKRSPERSDSPASVSKKPRLGSTESQELPVVDFTANGDDKTGARPKRQAAMNRPDYHALHHHIATPTGKWLELIANPQAFDVTISDGNFPRLPAELVSKAWIESPTSASDSSSSSYPSHLPPELFFGPNREPLIIKPEDGGFEGLGGKIPGTNFTVADVGRLVGMDRMVDVIDVATQQSSQWPLSKWVEYVQSRQNLSEPGPSTKTYNIISLEISGTNLAKKVRPPRLVSEIDWVDNFWNFGPAGKNAAKEASEHARQQQSEGMRSARAPSPVKVEGKGKAPATWPKVQLYCLMGAKGSWTDWHVDFAASSVYYTVHTGAKTFFFIRPTPKNLAAYAEWSGSYELQQSTWLGSMCDEVRKVTLRAGDTMIIPSGYIHSVHTPEDSIVFGGNFLHSYNIDAQLRLRQIEIDTKVPQRFRFPMFDRLCWYVAERYCNDLRLLRAYRPRAITAPPPLPSQLVLEGLFTLATFLVDQVTIMEDPEAEEKRRKLIFDRVPAEVVRDPAGLARELLWRVQREVPHLATPQTGLDNPKVVERNGKKGKGLVMLPSKAKSRVWNFNPSPWEQQDHPIKETTSTITAPRPSVSTLVSAITRPAGDEQAEETVHTYSQNRTRTRDLADGSTVLEEQKIIFEEKRTIWFPSVVKIEPEIEVKSPTTRTEIVTETGGEVEQVVNGNVSILVQDVEREAEPSGGVVA